MKQLETAEAVVYRGANRRYFSKLAAQKSFFRAAIKRRCECEDASWDGQYPGMVCRYHQGDFRDDQAKLLRRFLGIHFRARP